MSKKELIFIKQELYRKRKRDNITSIRLLQCIYELN